jgi:hypothetical protein
VSPCIPNSGRPDVPPFPPVGAVAALEGPCGSPPSLVLWGRKTAPPSIPVTSGLPRRSVPPPEEMGSSLGFLGNPFGNMPRARDSGGPRYVLALTADRVQPSTRITASASTTTNDFGAESSRPASLLCTLRTHQSLGEWQHSLPACLLALAGRDLHPLDSGKRFHLLITGPPLPSFSQRDIRLFQQATTYSVGGWPVRRFPRTCVSSSVSSRPRKLVNGIWSPVVGRRGSAVRDVATTEPTRC